MRFNRISARALCGLLVGAGAYGFYALNSSPNLTALSSLAQAQPRNLYRMMQDGNVKSVRFASKGWAYYVEVASPERVYVAGVRQSENTRPYESLSDPELNKLLAGDAEKKAADLMIVACGQTFGDDDYCDFYSPLHERPRSGKEIREVKGAVDLYQSVLSLAAAKVQRFAR